MAAARPIWRMLLRHVAFFAVSLDRARTGKSSAARIAIIAITTSSSMRVNALALSGVNRPVGGYVTIQYYDESIRSFCRQSGDWRPFGGMWELQPHCQEARNRETGWRIRSNRHQACDRSGRGRH